MNGECSATGKLRYATSRAAHLAIQHAYWGRRTTKQPKRVYFCKRCQGYHLSSNGDLWKRRERLAREQSSRGRISNSERPSSETPNSSPTSRRHASDDTES